MVSPEYKGPHPDRIAAAGTEHAEQVALFCWAAMHFERFPELRLMFAIPNGGERNKIVASNLKAEGVREGVPDIFLPAVRLPYHGLFIEMKRRKTGKHDRGRLSTEQKKWRGMLWSQGYGVVEAVGYVEARDTIIAYLNSGK